MVAAWPPGQRRPALRRTLALVLAVAGLASPVGCRQDGGADNAGGVPAPATRAVGLPLEVLQGVYYLGDSSMAYAIRGGDDIVVIDAGQRLRVGPALRQLDPRPGSVRFILLTHAHYDHAGLAGELQAGYPAAPILIHPDDADVPARRVRSDIPSSSDDLGDRQRQPGVAVQGFLADGQTFRVGDRELRVVHTPGHTAGSCCFLLTVPTDAGPVRVLFGGDTLGSSPNPGFWWTFQREGGGGDRAAYCLSIERLRALAAEVGGFDYILPGHELAGRDLRQRFTPAEVSDLLDRQDPCRVSP